MSEQGLFTSAFVNICSLTRLQALRLDWTDDAEAAALLPLLSRLVALQQLNLSVQTDNLVIPESLSHLLALTDITVNRAADCNALMHLPALKQLHLIDVQQPQIVPSELSSLRRLTQLDLFSVVLAGHVQSLSCLCALNHINFHSVRLAAGITPTALSLAVGCLTGLVSLQLTNVHVAGHLTVFAALSMLDTLVVDRGQLEHAVCSHNWQRLRDLDVSGNNLVSLPVGLTSLSMLTCLNLSDQQNATLQLNGLGDCCYGMPNLSIVHLYHVSGRWSADALCCIAEALSRAANEGFCCCF